MEIKHEQSDRKGAFKAIDSGVEAGIMTYTSAGESKIIIDHTEVNENFKGQGVGKKMVLAAVDFARKNQIKILPLCPFAAAVFEKDASLSDVKF